MLTLEQYQDRVNDAARAVAPFNAALGRRSLKQNEVDLLNQVATLFFKRQEPEATELPWITTARSKIGAKEIVGPNHNSWIVESWQKLGASWYNDDETPWCGLFVAWALNAAGIRYPKNFPAAKSFATYGTAVSPRYGAIAVKARQGGNHVFFIVGETEDRQYFKALGGNQSNAVNIMDIRKSDVTNIRWPAGQAIVNIPLPIMPRGTISENEA